MMKERYNNSYYYYYYYYNIDDYNKNMGGYGENAKKKGQENSFGVCIVN